MAWTENDANTAVCWRNNETLKTKPLTFESQEWLTTAVHSKSKAMYSTHESKNKLA